MLIDFKMPKKHRVQIEFSQREIDSLERIIKLTEHTSKASAINTALKVYYILLGYENKGYTVQLKKDDKVVQYVMLG